MNGQRKENRSSRIRFGFRKMNSGILESGLSNPSRPNRVKDARCKLCAGNSHTFGHGSAVLSGGGVTGLGAELQSAFGASGLAHVSAFAAFDEDRYNSGGVCRTCFPLLTIQSRTTAHSSTGTMQHVLSGRGGLVGRTGGTVADERTLRG